MYCDGTTKIHRQVQDPGRPAGLEGKAAAGWRAGPEVRPSTGPATFPKNPNSRLRLTALPNLAATLRPCFPDRLVTPPTFTKHKNAYLKLICIPKPTCPANERACLITAPQPLAPPAEAAPAGRALPGYGPALTRPGTHPRLGPALFRRGLQGHCRKLQGV